MRRAQIQRLLALAGVAAAAVTLAACDRAGEQSSGNRGPGSEAAQPERRADATGPGMTSREATPNAGAPAPGGAEPMAPAAADKPGAGAGASDATITAAVRAALAREPELARQNIDVKTTEGKVSLIGTVANAKASERAVQVAGGVQGVRSIENLLTVKGQG